MGCEKFAQDRSGGESGLLVRGAVNAFGMAGVVEDVLVVVLVLRVHERRFFGWTTMWSGGAGGVWFRDGVGQVHEEECPRLHRAGVDRFDFEVVRVCGFGADACHRSLPPRPTLPSH